MSHFRVSLVAALLAALAVPTSAALFIVDTTAVDLGDLVPGDGKCEWATFIPEGQRCTLRAAVREANALAGPDVILIPDGWHIVLSNAGANEDEAGTGDLDVLEDLGIGSFASPATWPIIDGNEIDRVFDVHAPAALTLSALAITGGKTLLPGGGVWVRAGAEADMLDCRIYANQGSGSAIRNQGSASVTRCSIFGNRGFNDFINGAIYNQGNLEILASTISGNSGANAAIRSNEGTLLTVRNTTIADNIGNPGFPSSGFGIESSGDLVLRNVTITGHAGTGLDHSQLGAFSSPSIRNSIIADNGTDCAVFIPGGLADIGHPNLDSDGSCGFMPAVGGLPNTDPMLAPLRLNGGTTLTMVPKTNSPVIDMGNNGTCETDDQRGAPRPLDGNEAAGLDCDIGAVEVLPCAGTPFLVVSGGFISIPVTYTGCFTVTVGPALDIVASGDATFRARDSVSFTNGFSVQAGGEFQVILDPAAGSGMTLP